MQSQFDKDKDASGQIIEKQTDINFVDETSGPVYKCAALGVFFNTDRRGFGMFRSPLPPLSLILWCLTLVIGLTSSATYIFFIIHDFIDVDGINGILTQELNRVINDSQVNKVFGHNFEIQGERTYGYSGGFVTIPRKLAYKIRDSHYMRLSVYIRSEKAKGSIVMNLRRERSRWICFYLKVNITDPPNTSNIVLVQGEDAYHLIKDKQIVLPTGVWAIE